MTSVASGFCTTRTVLKRENDGSHKNIGRQLFEFGPGEDISPNVGLIWPGRVSTRLDLQIRRRDFYDRFQIYVRYAVNESHHASHNRQYKTNNNIN